MMLPSSRQLRSNDGRNKKKVYSSVLWKYNNCQYVPKMYRRYHSRTLQCCNPAWRDGFSIIIIYICTSTHRVEIVEVTILWLSNSCDCTYAVLPKSAPYHRHQGVGIGIGVVVGVEIIWPHYNQECCSHNQRDWELSHNTIVTEY